MSAATNTAAVNTVVNTAQMEHLSPNPKNLWWPTAKNRATFKRYLESGHVLKSFFDFDYDSGENIGHFKDWQIVEIVKHYTLPTLLAYNRDAEERFGEYLECFIADGKVKLLQSLLEIIGKDEFPRLEIRPDILPLGHVEMARFLKSVNDGYDGYDDDVTPEQLHPVFPVKCRKTVSCCLCGDEMRLVTDEATTLEMNGFATVDEWNAKADERVALAVGKKRSRLDREWIEFRYDDTVEKKNDVFFCNTCPLGHWVDRSDDGSLSSFEWDNYWDMNSKELLETLRADPIQPEEIRKETEEWLAEIRRRF
jgi:hypothetical protein